MTRWLPWGLYYAVSDDGQVFSWAKGRLLRPWLHDAGYPMVLAHGRHQRVHRMVAEKFVPNFANKPEVNHKDLDKTNNHWSNLEWVTRQEQMAHAGKAGVMSRTGKSHHKTKILPAQAHCIAMLRGLGVRYKDIGSWFGIHPSHVGRVGNNKDVCED